MTRKTERRHEQGEQSRRRILEATVALAAERGYDGTSVALVTEATGLPASSVYWHFKNKDELLAETLEYSYRRWRETAPTWSNEVEPGDLGEQIHRRLHRAGAAFTESPEFWRLGLMLALERRVVEPAAKRRFLEVRRETRDAIADWWRRILPSGQDDDETATRLARFHLAVMDGLYIGMRTDRGWDRERLIDLIASGLHAHALRAGSGTAGRVS
jgi:AcrR family transcriptional regulator